MGGFCSPLDTFPNATIAEYGEVAGERRMMAEIHTRGPIACEVDATPLDKYQGGILNAPGNTETNHIISVVGWGTDPATGTKYWIGRNSWGEDWGKGGYTQIRRGRNDAGLEVEGWVPGS